MGVTTDATGAALVTTCQPALLRPAFAGTDGAAGTLHDKWRLRNVGTHTCTVQGFPAVQNYRADGRPLRTSARHSGTPSPALLTPGQHASFFLSYPEPGNLGCTGEPAARMTIRVPNTTVPLIARRGERACHGHLQETPLVHGG